jgi:hypothetical protein
VCEKEPAPEGRSGPLEYLWSFNRCVMIKLILIKRFLCFRTSQIFLHPIAILHHLFGLCVSSPFQISPFVWLSFAGYIRSWCLQFKQWELKLLDLNYLQRSLLRPPKLDLGLGATTLKHLILSRQPNIQKGCSHPGSRRFSTGYSTCSTRRSPASHKT